MTSSQKAWLPAGLPLALAVPMPPQPMTPSLYRDLLQTRLDELIQQDVKAARRAMELSQEDAPGLWAIAEQYPSSQWASAIVRSDQMTNLLAQSKGPGQQVPDDKPSLSEMLEALA